MNHAMKISVTSLFICCLIGGGLPATVPTTETADLINDVEFLKANVSALWEEVDEIKKGVSKPYGYGHGYGHGHGHGFGHGHRAVETERLRAMRHEYQVHHEGMKEDGHELHHDEAALAQVNFHHGLETPQQRENRVLTHEHHVHNEGKMHPGHEEHHDEYLYQHLVDEHGQVSINLEDMNEDENEYGNVNGDYDEAEEPFGDDGHIIDLENDPFSDHYGRRRRPCMDGKCPFRGTGDMRFGHHGQGHGGRCLWGPCSESSSESDSSSVEDYYDDDDNDDDDDDDDDDYDDDGEYVNAICRMRLNKGLPREERQAIRGSVVMKQKLSGGPVVYQVNLSGFGKFGVGGVKGGRLKRHGHGGRHGGWRRDSGWRRSGGWRRGGSHHSRSFSYSSQGYSEGQLHGFHVHEGGDLGRHDCGLAGGHYNPHSVHHGAPFDEYRHVGDLGNIRSDVRGQVKHLRIEDSVTSLIGDESIIGRSLVIHAHEDDLGRHPDIAASIANGNAGPRLACCVVEQA